MTLVAVDIDGLSSRQNGVTDDSFEDRNVRQLEPDCSLLRHFHAWPLIAQSVVEA
jgi:hypothetical protein